MFNKERTEVIVNISTNEYDYVLYLDYAFRKTT